FDSTFYCNATQSCADSPTVEQIVKIPVFNGTDTVEWYHCETVFSPDDNYRFLTIGNYSHDLADTVFIQPGLAQKDYYSFYIDSVSLVKVSEKENCEYMGDFDVPNVFTPNFDGTNDFIDFTSFDKVIILNRWGNTILIMESQSNFEWHGKNWKEEEVPAG